MLHVPVVQCAMDSVISDQAHDDTNPSTDEPNYENYNTKNNKRQLQHTHEAQFQDKKEKKKKKNIFTS